VEPLASAMDIQVDELPQSSELKALSLVPIESARRARALAAEDSGSLAEAVSWRNNVDNLFADFEELD
jgi:hypothetical protein